MSSSTAGLSSSSTTSCSAPPSRVGPTPDAPAVRTPPIPWTAQSSISRSTTSRSSRWDGDFNLDFAVFTEEGRRTGTGFNFGTPKHADIDLRGEELHGLSAFVLADDVVYHTYSTYDRGTDVLNATWQLLDRTPKGRGEDPDGWPRRHDEYPDE